MIIYRSIGIVGSIAALTFCTFIVLSPSKAQRISIFTDPETGARLGLPARMLASRKKSKYGYNWRSDRGRLNVDLLNFGDKRKLAELYTTLKKRRGRKIELDDYSSSSFILAGSDRDRTRFFLRVQAFRNSLSGTKVLGLSIVYDPRGGRRLATDALNIRRSLIFDDKDQPTQTLVAKLRQIADEVGTSTNKAKSQWGSFALTARHLRFRVGIEETRSVIRKLLRSFKESPLDSRIWGVVPMGIPESFISNTYTTNYIYGDKTEYPRLRQEILDVLAAHPSDPFAFAAKFAVGDFQSAISADKLLYDQGMMRYAIAHKSLSAFLAKINPTLPAVETPPEMDEYDKRINFCAKPTSKDKCLFFERFTLNTGTETDRLGTFLRRAQAAPAEVVRSALKQYPGELRLIERNLDNASEVAGRPHNDDANFLRGILRYYNGDLERAIASFEVAAGVKTKYGWLDDYSSASVRWMVKILQQLPPAKGEEIVSSSSVFSNIPALWYVLARERYRQFDYPEAIRLSMKGLKRLGIEVWRLPASTSSDKIEKEIKRLVGKDDNYYPDTNLLELVYIMNASREFSNFDALLDKFTKDPEGDGAKQVRATILKYSLLTTSERERERLNKGTLVQHRDLRQAVHLINSAIVKLAHFKSSELISLREWLHYRKVRTLTIFKPRDVESSVRAFEKAHPTSSLVDDAYVELLYSAITSHKDYARVKRAFEMAKMKASKGNALDNAYSWYAIYLRCIGRRDEARSVNLEILSRFKFTRHAVHAAKRLALPTGCALEGFY